MAYLGLSLTPSWTVKFQLAARSVRMNLLSLANAVTSAVGWEFAVVIVHSEAGAQTDVEPKEIAVLEQGS